LRDNKSLEDLANGKKIADALRESQRKYQTLVETIGDVVWETDAEGKCTFVSSQIERILGFKTSDVIGNTPFDFVPQAEKEQALKMFIAHAQAKQPIRGYISPGYTARGELVYVETNALPYFDDQGKLLGFRGITRDITERKKAEKELKENEELYRSLFDNSDDGFILFETITEGTGETFEFRFLKVNSAYERQTGRKADALVGKTTRELAPKLEPEWLSVGEQVVKSGKSAHIVSFNNFTKKWYDAHFIPFSKGQVGILFRDITVQKAAEYLLKRKDRELNCILDSTPTIIFYKDKQGKIIQANNSFARALNVSKEDLLGKTVFDLYSPEIAKNMTNDDLAVMTSKQPKLGTIEPYESPTGLRWIKTDKIPSFDEKGEVDGIIGFSEEITERKALEKQLQEKERLAAIGATAGMVGHDIRNPLQAIVGDLYLLKSDVDSISQTATKASMIECIEEIEKNLAYINKIVVDLQDFARPLKPEYSKIDISEIMNNIVKEVYIPREIMVQISANTFIKIRSDPTYVRRILHNLVNNAIQAMPGGGNLDLTVFTKNDKTCITVADTGSGIPDEVKPKLFTPMMTTKAKGQGFGLAVAKRLVEALNGTISFESELGKGTKFTIELHSN
jgi:PAS domain S-box-containing protein